MKALFKQFSFPAGISSHVAPTTPGSIHEGGELGYSLSMLSGRVRQSRSDRRPASSAMVKRKRAPWRPHGSPTSLSTQFSMEPCCRSCTSMATRSAIRPCWPASNMRNWRNFYEAAAGRLTLWKGMSRKRCMNSWPVFWKRPSRRSGKSRAEHGPGATTLGRAGP